MDIAALILGLAAAVALGFADFSGGAAARHVSPSIIAAWTWGIVGVLGLGIGPLGAGSIRLGVLAWGLAGGVLAAIGTTLLFDGIAHGRVAIVAPLSAVVGASVPVLLDRLAGAEFSREATVGIGLALVGVALTTQSRSESGGSIARSLATGGGAGLALALLFVVTANTLDDGVWVIAPVGLATCGILIGAAVATGRSVWISRPAAGWTAAAGIGTAIAYTSFLLSAAESSFGIAAVVTSLYPAVTVLAAAVIWKEKPAGIQRLGLAAVVLAVALLGAG